MTWSASEGWGGFGRGDLARKEERQKVRLGDLTTVDHATPVSAMDGGSAPDSNKEKGPWHLRGTAYQIPLIPSPFIPNPSASYELLL